MNNSIGIQVLWNFIKAQGLGARTGWSPYRIASGALEGMGHARDSGMDWKDHCLSLSHLIKSLAPSSISRDERKVARRKRKKGELSAKLAFVVRAEQIGYEKAGGKQKRAAPEFQPHVMGDEFLSSYEWRRVRMVALTKYGPVCQCCGANPSTGAVMNVDHIKPRRIYPELALDVNNLQILCHDCNHGKGNWT